MRIYSATDVGQKRKMNQDYVFASEGPVGNLPNLFTVADGMGGHNAGDYASSTTMVVATIVDQYAYVANVGDSRLYVIQDGIRQVTRDHSLVQEMVRMGEISEAEARNHPDKNIITRALGAEKTVDVDFFDLKLEKGCTILMCSDGLSNMVEDEKIQEIISDPEADIDQKGSALLREANQNGGKDNIAVVLVEPFTNEVEAC